MEHMMHGWHLNREPALDEIIVTDDRDVVASRPLPRELSHDPDAWDRALTNLGYTRTGDWTPTEGGQRCTVQPATG
ncbi:MAG: hypothetical protein ACRD0W_14735 [Acidimicrobiales bacterium]